MRGIIWGLIKEAVRNPWGLLAMYALTIVFVFVLGNSDLAPSIRVPVYSEELSDTQVEEAVESLNQELNLAFYVTSKENIQGIEQDQGSQQIDEWTVKDTVFQTIQEETIRCGVEIEEKRPSRSAA